MIQAGNESIFARLVSKHEFLWSSLVQLRRSLMCNLQKGRGRNKQLGGVTEMAGLALQRELGALAFTFPI